MTLLLSRTKLAVALLSTLAFALLPGSAFASDPKGPPFEDGDHHSGCYSAFIGFGGDLLVRCESASSADTATGAFDIKGAMTSRLQGTLPAYSFAHSYMTQTARFALAAPVAALEVKVVVHIDQADTLVKTRMRTGSAYADLSAWASSTNCGNCNGSSYQTVVSDSGDVRTVSDTDVVLSFILSRSCEDVGQVPAGIIRVSVDGWASSYVGQTIPDAGTVSAQMSGSITSISVSETVKPECPLVVY